MQRTVILCFGTYMALSVLTHHILAQEKCSGREISGHGNASIKYQLGSIIQVSPVKEPWTRFDLAFVQSSIDRYTFSLARSDDQLMMLVWNERQVLLLQPTYLCLCFHSEVTINITFHLEKAGSTVRVSWSGYGEVVPLSGVTVLDFARVNNFGDTNLRVNLCTPGNLSGISPTISPKKHESKVCPKCGKLDASGSDCEYLWIGSLVTSMVILFGLLPYIVHLKRNSRKIRNRRLDEQQEISRDLSTDRQPSPPPLSWKTTKDTAKIAHNKYLRHNPINQGQDEYVNSFPSHLVVPETTDSDGYLNTRETKMQTFSIVPDEEEEKSSDKGNASDLGSSESLYEEMA
ncbi:uncharacterized protein [Palaemon carinicauda]|uniref:uncharacterized protein n=1 Tax=Palaemon carinicauda TaxID=392227 RepID=UPI0035B58AF0